MLDKNASRSEMASPAAVKRRSLPFAQYENQGEKIPDTPTASRRQRLIETSKPNKQSMNTPFHYVWIVPTCFFGIDEVGKQAIVRQRRSWYHSLAASRECTWCVAADTHELIFVADGFCPPCCFSCRKLRYSSF
jgi:hypothetical protein